MITGLVPAAACLPDFKILESFKPGFHILNSPLLQVPK